MIELKDDELVFRFPTVHADAACRIGFQRTLRIPDDNRAYRLPPGLGRFPLRHVDDHLDRIPKAWGRHGGVFLPMYQAEAMWLHFDAAYPMAVKVAAGKIDALTGEGWTNELSARRQNYLVVPDQPWLDGFNVGRGLIRQFVAMPLLDRDIRRRNSLPARGNTEGFRSSCTRCGRCDTSKSSRSDATVGMLHRKRHATLSVWRRAV